MKHLGWITSLAVAASLAAVGCSGMSPVSGSGGTKPTGVGIHPGGVLTSDYRGTLVPKKGDQLAMFALGCFWGSETTYRRVKGVVATAVGYSGGTTPNPTYEEVCSGRTGHSEVVLVVFDPKVVSYDQLLKVFWESHDPTQGMRQGNDAGTQYRSAIYTSESGQQDAAERSRKSFQDVLSKGGFGEITTEIAPAGPFYFAEGYHQQYLAKNPGGYCGLGGTGVSCPVGVADVDGFALG